MNFTLYAATIITAAGIFFSCGEKAGSQDENKDSAIETLSGSIHASVSPAPADSLKETGIAAAIEEIIKALKEKNFSILARHAHPVKGIRFSPNTFIEKTDPVFDSLRILGLPSDKTKFKWGQYDGSGEPILLTFEEYYKRFVFDRDYSSAPEKKVNGFLGRGNTINNVKEFFPGSQTADFHFPGSEKNNFMDWSILRLVFETHEGKNYLVALVHDQWSI